MNGSSLHLKNCDAPSAPRRRAGRSTAAICVADDLRQEVVDHDPLVVPAHHPLRLLEAASSPLSAGSPRARGRRPVVEPDEQQVQLRDDQVLVVARVADQRPALLVARQVVDSAPVAPRCGRRAASRPRGLRLPSSRRGTAGPSGPSRRASRGRSAACGSSTSASGSLSPLELRRRVEGDVVVDELPEVRVAGRERWLPVETLARVDQRRASASSASDAADCRGGGRRRAEQLPKRPPGSAARSRARASAASRLAERRGAAVPAPVVAAIVTSGCGQDALGRHVKLPVPDERVMGPVAIVDADDERVVAVARSAGPPGTSPPSRSSRRARPWP